MLRSSILRASRSTSIRKPATALNAARAPIVGSHAYRFQQTRNSTHAISNPTLANIESRWEQMPPQEQADLWMALRDRMKTDWHELTVPEKKAAYWIAFGPHGPRAEAPPGENMKVFVYTMLGLAVSGVLFYITRVFAHPPPKTMSKEWQEATNEYLKEQMAEPITGISAEGYKGKGMVQSKATGIDLDALDEEE